MNYGDLINKFHNIAGAKAYRNSKVNFDIIHTRLRMIENKSADFNYKMSEIALGTTDDFAEKIVSPLNELNEVKESKVSYSLGDNNKIYPKIADLIVNFIDNNESTLLISCKNKYIDNFLQSFLAQRVKDKKNYLNGKIVRIGKVSNKNLLDKYKRFDFEWSKKQNILELKAKNKKLEKANLFLTKSKEILKQVDVLNLDNYSEEERQKNNKKIAEKFSEDFKDIETLENLIETRKLIVKGDKRGKLSHRKEQIDKKLNNINKTVIERSSVIITTTWKACMDNNLFYERFDNVIILNAGICDPVILFLNTGLSDKRLIISSSINDALNGKNKKYKNFFDYAYFESKIEKRKEFESIGIFRNEQ